MAVPTITQALQWRPESLRDAAREWDRAAGGLDAEAEIVVQRLAGSHEYWTGAVADAARDRGAALTNSAQRIARAFIEAAVVARCGADRITIEQDAVVTLVADARAAGLDVTDDGTVAAPADVSDLTRIICGGDPALARTLIDSRARTLSAELNTALARLAIADSDTAADIDTAFTGAAAPAVATRPAGAWPVGPAEVVATWPSTSQDRIAAQIVALTPQQKRQLIAEAPSQVGNTDGVPWEMRVAANRINIADAILAERRVTDIPDEDKLRDVIRRDFGTGIGNLDLGSAERVWAAAHVDPGLRGALITQHDRDAKARITFYQGLLAEVDDPAASGRVVGRQILAFDPKRASLIELNGDLAHATSVGVLVPGLGTTVIGSAETTETARRFVAASHGDVAMITYLGGPFPTGDLATGLLHAADPDYATNMAPRLVAFSEDVNRTVDTTAATTGRTIPVTYIGHSYGGSIVGTAERLGLTADRTIYVAAAGAGVDVLRPTDWHNRNPDVLRFAMTAPFDPIEAVQGIPFGPHGADPDEMPGVIELDTGRRLDGSTMSGLAAHSDVLNEPSDAWRNILGVITGDRDRLLQLR